jgi:hypothetical protein
MTLKAFCVTLGLLGLLSGYAIASPFNEGDERSNIKPEDAIELLVTCEASFPAAMHPESVPFQLFRELDGHNSLRTGY